mgnify:CR=1 FL=1
MEERPKGYRKEHFIHCSIVAVFTNQGCLLYLNLNWDVRK